MPVSSPKGKDIIRNWFKKRDDISSITDIGPGSGTYLKLLGWDRYIWKAVEIWKPYLDRFMLRLLYDEIVVGNVRDVKIPDADCAILGDVLEHLEKKDAIGVFERVDKQFKHVVISIPTESHSQYVFEGNEYEKHLSVWTKEELEKLVPETYTVREFIKPMYIFIK